MKRKLPHQPEKTSIIALEIHSENRAGVFQLYFPRVLVWQC